MFHTIAKSIDCNPGTAESVKISPKLDFVESKEDGSSKTSGGRSPKIQGVRVVVDTTKSKKSTESKSSESDVVDADDDGARQLKTVGIRTDITLEITDDADVDADADDGANKTANKTKTKSINVVDAEDDADDSVAIKDRRVPVIKGSGTGGGAPKPDKPSSEEGGWNVHNVPVVYGSKDAHSGNRRWDATPRLMPPQLPVWTTERPPPAPLPPRPHYYLTDYYHSRGASPFCPFRQQLSRNIFVSIAQGHRSKAHPKHRGNRAAVRRSSSRHPTMRRRTGKPTGPIAGRLCAPSVLALHRRRPAAVRRAASTTSWSIRSPAANRSTSNALPGHRTHKLFIFLYNAVFDTI